MVAPIELRHKQYLINANVDLSMIEMNRILMKNNPMLIAVKS